MKSLLVLLSHKLMYSHKVYAACKVFLIYVRCAMWCAGMKAPGWSLLVPTPRKDQLTLACLTLVMTCGFLSLFSIEKTLLLFILKCTVHNCSLTVAHYWSATLWTCRSVFAVECFIMEVIHCPFSRTEQRVAMTSFYSPCLHREFGCS